MGLRGRILEAQPLKWIGRLSYSIYIWQQLFLVMHPVESDSSNRTASVLSHQFYCRHFDGGCKLLSRREEAHKDRSQDLPWGHPSPLGRAGRGERRFGA